MAVTGCYKCELVSRMRGKAKCKKKNNVKMHVNELNVIGWNEMFFPVAEYSYWFRKDSWTFC